MFSTYPLMFGIAAFIGGSSLFTIFITQIAFQDSWICAILALVLCFLVVSIYLALVRRFPRLGLLQMHTLVYGKACGRFINLLYLLFCFLFTAVSLRNLGDFFIGYIMTETPMAVVLVLLACTCAVAAHGGIALVLRNAFLFFLFMSLALLTNSLLLIPNMELSNFLPVFTLSASTYMKASFILAAAPFGEIFVFLILLPYATPEADIRKSFLWGLLLGGLYLFFTFLRDIACLGVALSYLTEPTYEAVRLINLMDVFSRLEIVFAFTLIAMRVFKLSVLFCAILRSFEDVRARPIEKRGRALVLVSAISIFLALYLFRTGITLPEWFRDIGSYIFAVFEMTLPALTLVVAIVRRKHGNPQRN